MITIIAVELKSSTYWENSFKSLYDIKELVEFYVIDVQLETLKSGKRALATVEVARSNDFSKTFITRTHLGYLLNPGDHALGYDLSLGNFNSENFTRLESSKTDIPDVILVKKSYPNARKKNKKRAWRLKGMAKEEEAELLKSKNDQAKAEEDYELFLRDIEEDPELRAMMNLYKGILFFLFYQNFIISACSC